MLWQTIKGIWSLVSISVDHFQSHLPYFEKYLSQFVCKIKNLWYVHGSSSFTEPNSPLKAFLLQSAKMSPEEKATFLEKDEVIKYCVF